MILTVFITILIVSFFSAESLISTAVGGAISVGLTHWIKAQTGLQGVGATILAFMVSIIVAISAYIISTMMTTGTISYETIPQGAAQIFALATLTYKMLLADGSQSVQ